MTDFIDGIGIAKVVAAATTVTIFVVIVWRRYFSSISDIPGPFFASFSLLWQVWQIFKRHTEAVVIEQHQKYGKYNFQVMTRAAELIS
jgi:hypothetical protein